VVFLFGKLENIDYLVLRFLNSGVPPFAEQAEEWLHNSEDWSSIISVTATGGDLI
jgi:hypothetical protein